MINYSKEYFGKDLNELQGPDIESFFEEEKEESDKIEFKAFHSEHGNFNKNLEGVIRGICAFLNSNGGILIWGAPLGIKEDDRVVFKGDLSPVKELKEKDTLISKISDSITPLPVNINVETIGYKEDYLYIFEVQQSSYSPHQYKNNYWARLDGQTKPAPHYLIEALFKKISYPNIEGYINLDRFGTKNSNFVYLQISILLINFSELQNEHDLIYRVICPQAKFEGSFHPALSRNYDMDGHQYINKAIEILHFRAPEITTQNLLFNMEELADNHNYEMDLIFTFGGKTSPLKLSEYKLNFGKGLISSIDPIHLFEEKSENILMSKKQQDLGTTKENLLERILKR